jgi:hypothetical protein
MQSGISVLTFQRNFSLFQVTWSRKHRHTFIRWQSYTPEDSKCHGQRCGNVEPPVLLLPSPTLFLASGATLAPSKLTLSLLMSYIYGATWKPEILTSCIYMDLILVTLKAVSFYLLNNISTLNQCRKFSSVTVVCKHFVSYQDYPNYRWDLIR